MLCVLQDLLEGCDVRNRLLTYFDILASFAICLGGKISNVPVLDPWIGACHIHCFLLGSKLNFILIFFHFV